jgi:hypothetical protein
MVGDPTKEKMAAYKGCLSANPQHHEEHHAMALWVTLSNGKRG